MNENQINFTERLVLCLSVYPISLSRRFHLFYPGRHASSFSTEISSVLIAAYMRANPYLREQKPSGLRSLRLEAPERRNDVPKILADSSFLSFLPAISTCQLHEQTKRGSQKETARGAISFDSRESAVTFDEPLRDRASVLLSMDAHSIRRDTSITGIEIKEPSG